MIHLAAVGSRDRRAGAADAHGRDLLPVGHPNDLSPLCAAVVKPPQRDVRVGDLTGNELALALLEIGHAHGRAAPGVERHGTALPDVHLDAGDCAVGVNGEEAHL